MNIQQQASSEAFKALINDESKRVMVIRTLIKTLSSLGYQQTVSTLQKESFISDELLQIEKMRELLSSHEYDLAILSLNDLNLPQGIKRNSIQLLNELKIMILIDKNDYEQALTLIYNHISKEETQLQLYQTIALGQEINYKLIASRHEYIIKNCITDTIEESSVESLLENIIYYKDHPMDNLLKNPPKYQIAKSHSLTNIVGKVSFVKFNKDCSEIALISQSIKEYELSVWKVVKNKIKRIEHLKSTAIGWINCLKWIDFTEEENVLVLSYHKIRMYSKHKLEFLFQIERKTLKKGRFLCADIDPRTKIVYAGGLFQGLIGFNKKGQIINEIHTFTQIRELVFEESGLLYFISATKGQLFKFDMQSQRKMDTFNANQCFMDLKYLQKHVIITNRRHIFVFNDHSLAPTITLDAPINEKTYKIQAFLINNWIITFNEKLLGVLKTEQTLTHHKWQDTTAIDIENNQMITFRGNLTLYHIEPSQDSDLQDNDNESSKYENLMMDEYDEPSSQEDDNLSFGEADVWIEIEEHDEQESLDQQGDSSIQS